MRWLLMLVLSAGLARADGERAGDFDYYVLALSWSPTFCALEGEARGNPQCDRPMGWVLHGLWPQYDDGWPSYCWTSFQEATRAQTSAMVDIMGSSGSAWHQWKKHGRCSGLSAGEYFDAARTAYDTVNRPEVFRKLDRDVRLPPRVVEDAFLKANPEWEADMLTITCKSGRIQEARLCLTRDFEPRVCGQDVVRDCSMSNALFEAID
ncbi:ribonuclease T2 family protein [Actibacterium pelagium]|uniref:Ribonuclease T(2) n=1 Tax=Actibacterium pelagium TaxID=2029103 RepID=A0A917EJN6_9RHOB|nr:ribonuclease T2 [Actibacterium pelagium]GGE51555.1 ribonuclease T(2) [Actibacterium pelagium]